MLGGESERAWLSDVEVALEPCSVARSDDAASDAVAVAAIDDAVLESPPSSSRSLESMLTHAADGSTARHGVTTPASEVEAPR